MSPLMKTSSKDKRTATLLLARFGSKVRLASAAPTPGLKSVLKVTTLEDSLRSCASTQRASLTLEALGSSIRNLFGGKPSDDDKAVSFGRGMDMLKKTTTAPEEEEEPTVTLESSSMEMSKATKQVGFSTLERRLYSVAPSDNPSVTGLGAAIALDGWRFLAEPVQSVDVFESRRPPRKSLENLKLSMMDRQDRLKEHGASAREIQLFAKRVKKAKTKRAETVEAFSLYGNQHLLREEKKENTKRWLLKLFRLRKQQGEEQAALWEQAQKTQPTEAASLAGSA